MRLRWLLTHNNYTHFWCSRYNYDKKTGEMLAADDDHPLKSSDFSFSNLTMSENNSDQITAELTSVAVDWKPFRSTTICSCSTPLDQINPKVSVAVYLYWAMCVNLGLSWFRIIVDVVVTFSVSDASIVGVRCPAMTVAYRYPFARAAISSYSKIVRNFSET